MIEAVIGRCAGTDVGKKFLIVCVMTGSLDAESSFGSSRTLSANGCAKSPRAGSREDRGPRRLKPGA